MRYHLHETRLKRCAASILLVSAASVLSIAARPLFSGKSPLAFFILAVLCATAYNGAAQGLLATALSLGIAGFFFGRDLFVLPLAQYTLTLFAAIGVAISIVIGRFRLLNQQLSEARDELKLANQKLAEHADALSRSNAELERFAYAVAHDLNAPLRTIGSCTALCLERSGDKIDRESKDMLRLVLRSAESMGHLIRNLLTLARVGHNASDSETQLNAEDLVRRSLECLRDEIAASRATIEIERLPVIRGNADQLSLLFQNLISNSLKYRNEKSPAIRISAVLEGDAWRFMVSDNGIGIDPKYHVKIFEPFQRLHAVSQYGGTGLGLTICERIVSQHGGRIWVESTKGDGSRFYFTLPALGSTLPVSADAGLRASSARNS